MLMVHVCMVENISNINEVITSADEFVFLNWAIRDIE